ncbi:hypothetical protein GCM10008101_18290 [Lysobacter xinjiangensis]|uniref:DUF2894 domain-containing protein n=1 Tax=Cognatilysobacter xinjiangensis TaxID=546892 RepID=A0ABQ3C2L5_9GAMM|nr:DUF2894 domain-containing protein [Lysobacter xinjiangensis]GGZ64893.1 hypothetical protein GCM10008101_18290 [Lysobacter xinjiangensis]
MSDAVDIAAMLATLQQRGADRLDPLCYARIRALSRRAADRDGGLRRVLDARIAELASACLASLDASHAAPARDGSRQSARNAFAALHERLAADTASPKAQAATTALDELHRASATARARSQMRQALDSAPQDAGPLNSTLLVHRALTLMRDVSPDYLQAFMGYVDALAWLDGMTAKAAPASATPIAGPKRPRAKPRTRRA